MIYLHDPPLLFLKPRKVGGTSLEIALSAFAGPDDILTRLMFDEEEALRRRLGGRTAQNFAFAPGEAPEPADLRRAQRRGRASEKFYSHISAAKARERLGAERWSSATRVSIVRNPFDLAVSSYFWRQVRGKAGPDFAAWCRDHAPLLLRNRASYGIDGEIVVDRLWRYERIGEEVAALEQALPRLSGLAAIFGRTRAKSGYRPRGATTRELFDRFPAARQVIAAVFAEEIARYGYRPE